MYAYESKLLHYVWTNSQVEVERDGVARQGSSMLRMCAEAMLHSDQPTVRWS